MKKILLIFIVTLILGCANKAEVGVKSIEDHIVYKIPFDKGLILRKDGVIKIMLRFYTHQTFLLSDTAETLHAYILSTKWSVDRDCITLEKPKVFFIRVKMHPWYDFINEESIRIIKGKELFYLSGKLPSTNVNQNKGNLRELNLSFNKLPLNEVFLTSELLKYDIDYFKEVLEKNFSEFVTE